MEHRLPHILHVYNVFCENDGSENCAKVLKEQFNEMFGIKSLNDKHDCNVASMNSSNIHDVTDMQSHKLGIPCLMKMIFLVPQVLMCKFIMMIACVLFMTIAIFMKMGLEECQL